VLGLVAGGSPSLVAAPGRLTRSLGRRMSLARYPEWLTHVFDHEVTEPNWFFDVDEPEFRASDRELAELFSITMKNSGRDLCRYSDAQVDQGLNYIFSNSCSNFTFSILDGEIEVELKVAALRSIQTLYTDCFEVRCSPTLSHLDEPGSRLNHMCYMLWDLTPLNYWEGRPERTEAYSAIVDVMEAGLASHNLACVEGALHGLGHTFPYLPERIGPLIARYIARNPSVRPELLRYARNAAVGHVL